MLSSSNTQVLLPSFTDSADQSAPLPTPTIENITQGSLLNQPLLVYSRRQPHVQPPSPTVLPSDSSPSTESQVQDLPSILPSLRRTARVSIPPDRYGFQTSKVPSYQPALSATLHSIAIPATYSQAATESCWCKKNYMP